MRKTATTLILVTLAAAPAPVLAEETPAGLTGEAELGLIVTGGNTETENLNAKAKVGHDGATWRHALKGEAVLASDKGGSTAERYFVSGKSDRKVGARGYLFVTASWEKDRFSGYEYRVTEALGYGHRLVETDAVTLDLEAGPGARHSRLTGDGTDDEALGRLAGNLAWKVSDTSNFTEDLTVEAGEQSTITRSVTALKTQVAGQLATKVSVTVKNTSDTPPGVDDTDYETAVTLVYGF